MRKILRNLVNKIKQNKMNEWEGNWVKGMCDHWEKYI
jgi:hypothetical protein